MNDNMSGVGIAVGIAVGIVTGISLAFVLLRKLKKGDIEVVFIENLDDEIILEWFRKNKSDTCRNVKYVISNEFEKLLGKELFSSLKDMLSGENKLLQIIYDEDNSKIIDFRIINFKNIQTHLQTSIEENNGTIVIANV